jgi:hypothetical protein
MVDIFALLCQYSVHNYPFTVNTDWQSKKRDSFTHECWIAVQVLQKSAMNNTISGQRSLR